jgi:hypothetical protein
VQGEVVLDGHADAPLDLRVAIDEPQTELTRQVTPNRGLATAGHADEGDGDI